MSTGTQLLEFKDSATIPTETMLWSFFWLGIIFGAVWFLHLLFKRRPS